MRNDSKYYSMKPQPRVLFHETSAESIGAMEPYELGILEEGDSFVPLIKIVFALATRKPSLSVVRCPPNT